MPSLHTPAPMPKRERPAQEQYNPFQVEDPPAVGVDPAVFPIHRTAPQHHVGQRIIFGLVGVLMVLVVAAFVAGGETEEERAMRHAKEERANTRALAEKRVAGGSGRVAAAGRESRGNRTIRRAPGEERKSRAAKRAERPRGRRRIARKPFAFAPGNVKQPKSYGAHAEHVPPPDTKPLLIVMSTPQALVFRDGKLAGATPMLMPVDPKIESISLTLKNHGYLDKTIDVRRSATGNLEASVVLEKDPAWEGRKVANPEKPKNKS
jgi:hypothetical protein